MHARDQPEVQRRFRRHADSADELRRVNLTDDVGELRAGREPLDVALGSRPPRDRHFIRRTRRDQFAADARDRPIRIVVQRSFGMRDVRNLVVEKPSERAHQPAFALSLLAEKEHVVTGNERDVDLGYDGVLVADDAGKQFFAVRQHPQKVVAKFLLDGFGNPAAGS